MNSVSRTYVTGLAAIAIAAIGVFGFVITETSKSWAAEGARSDLVNRQVLRVCADPANLPFSGKDEPGFENKIAEIVADELNVPVEYTWFPQATGFIRRTLFAKRCDLVIGYAQGDTMVLNTNHYYTSAYSLIYPKGKGLDGIDSLSDPRLVGKKIGIIAGTPPATILALKKLIQYARPYQLTVDRRHFSPAEEMTKDLRSGKVDIGIMWGPMAGYFAQRGGEQLTVVPLLKEKVGPRMSFRITMGVRRADTTWKKKLNEIIAKRQADINKVLASYGVPLFETDARPTFDATNAN
ncbi:MAG: substrate-binding domain-containing protein [Hyphomicrobiaceae bacterium]